MYKIKQKTGDFVVIEIPDREFEKEGKYSVWKLTKKNYNTEDAVQTVAKALHIQRKQISYAGTKDRNALTEQHITIINVNNANVESLELKDIFLEYVGQTKTPLSLGDLKGNKFKIVIRNLDKGQITTFRSLISSPPIIIPNYFGEQRFQTNNTKIGKLLVKRKFAEAAELLKEDYQYGEKIKEYLDNYKGDSINALRQIPKKILSIYVHAYQSILWNETVEKLLKANKETHQRDVPLIGFGMEIKDETTEKIIIDIMKEEELSERDFIIREFPEISAEGGNRKLYAEIDNFEISEHEEDELNQGKNKITIKFELGKGSYATTVIKQIFS